MLLPAPVKIHSLRDLNRSGHSQPSNIFPVAENDEESQESFFPLGVRDIQLFFGCAVGPPPENKSCVEIKKPGSACSTPSMYITAEIGLDVNQFKDQVGINIWNFNWSR